MTRIQDMLRPPSMTEATPQDPDTDPAPLADLPRFLPPRPVPPGPANPDPAGPELMTRPTSDRAAADFASSGTNTSSIPEFFKQRSKSYAKIAGALLMASGGWLNKLSGEEETGAFIPDEEDTDTIPPPLGRLAARRIKLGDPNSLSDMEDIGMAAVGIAVWVAKGVTAVLHARADRRRLAKQVAMHQDQGDGQ